MHCVGKPPATRSRRANGKRRLSEAATRLFGERGYNGARTAQIAAMAGVTERTLFRYFPTKKALYRRVMFPAILAAALPRGTTHVGRLFASDSESFPGIGIAAS